MSKKPIAKRVPIRHGNGNVFADLGFERPEEELLKAQLVREIREIIKRRSLTQAKAADLLSLKLPDVSAMVTGRVHKFSLEQLLRCARRLDQDIAIVIRPKRRGRTSSPHRRAVAA
jgi:predicted XRE-type DNA-binding protein